MISFLSGMLVVETHQKRHTTSKPDDKIEKPHNFAVICSIGSLSFAQLDSWTNGVVEVEPIGRGSISIAWYKEVPTIVYLIRKMSGVPCRKINTYRWGYPILTASLKTISFDSTMKSLFASFNYVTENNFFRLNDEELVCVIFYRTNHCLCWSKTSRAACMWYLTPTFRK